jgi:hypothetical protein
MKRVAIHLFLSAGLILFITGEIRAAEKLIAYPVPFDPNNQTLSLKYEPTRSAGSVSVEIFDINGDKVLGRDYSDIANFTWKGYNGAGRKVSTGLYIIKVRWEDSVTGQVRTDLVRVTLVERKR